VKQSNDVFFFTLIDFLAQALFFGLVLIVLHKAAHRNEDAAARQAAREAQESRVAVQHTLRAAGVSNLTELTDYLTRLSPNHDLRGTAEFFDSAGGINRVKEVQAIAAAAGGTERLREKLKKYDEAYGLHPCHTTRQGKPVPIATLELHDDQVVVQSRTKEFDRLIERLGTSTRETASLSLAEFQTAFAGLRALERECRHYVNVRACTRFLDPAESVQSVGFQTYVYTRCR
jgi:hypothetical protein